MPHAGAEKPLASRPKLTMKDQIKWRVTVALLEAASLAAAFTIPAFIIVPALRSWCKGRQHFTVAHVNARV